MRRAVQRRRPQSFAPPQPESLGIRLPLPDQPQQPPQQTSLSVVIVGAGFGGLAAAWYLTQCGCTVTIFEARDRVGGRVLSLTHPVTGRIIEGGAELIGTNHPCWLFFARRFALGLNVVTSDDLFSSQGLEVPLFLDGRRLSRADVDRINDELDRAEKQMNADARGIDPYQPWTAPRAQEWDALSLGDWIASLDVSDLCKDALEATFANNNGEPSKQQSYLANLSLVRGGGVERFWTDTEVFRCATGNQSLATRMLQEIEDQGGAVHLSTPVTGIGIDEGGAAVRTNGTTTPADYVVLAIPPSTWGNVEISPAIPDDMYVHMGVNIKFLSTVHSRFWLSERLAATSTADTFGMSWEGTDNQTVLPQQGIDFTVFAGGNAARRALDSAEPRQYFARAVGRLYPAYEHNLVDGTFMAWPHDPWTRAGYSCPQPGQVCRVGPFLNSAFSERLYFAGEHACPAFFGFMEGALESGIMAAARICATEGIPKPPSIY